MSNPTGGKKPSAGLHRFDLGRPVANARLPFATLQRQGGRLLFGRVAHDFNNILSAVIGYTELALSDAEPDSTLYRNLQEVFRASGRAKDLVKQILTFSRQTEQELKPVQIKLICKEVIKFLRASLPTSTKIHQDLQSDSLTLAYPTQIHQVLMNLCTNAGYAMGEKLIRIKPEIPVIP